MDASKDLAPAVQSILDTARTRDPSPEHRVSVTARSLPAAIRTAEADGRTPVIAEIKPTSPTTDTVRDDDPVALAAEMVDAGACALSVLTEPDHFGGSTETLSDVRSAVSVPILRKDFILEPAQLDAVAADIVLLIARFVPDLEPLIDAARSRGFQVLVEVHTESELQTAVRSGADIVGINNRDLASLTVDLDTFESVVTAAPSGTILVAESGIGSPEDVRRMRAAGADALLIGSAIMAGDVRERTAAFVEAER